MKPIEAGCLAIITAGEFAGKECKVLEFIGIMPDRPEFHEKRWWKVEPYFDLPKDKMPFAGEGYLMRIDGYEERVAETISEADDDLMIDKMRRLEL